MSQSAPQPEPIASAPLAGGGSVLLAAGGVWALLIGIAFLMLGNGLQGSLLGVRAEGEGFSATITGVVMACYFVGFLIGSRIAIHAIRRVGHLRVFAAATCFASLAILIHGLVVTPVIWAIMRLVTGLSLASAYIVTESWLNDRVSNEHRGGLLAVYMMVTYLGLAGGQLLLNVAAPRHLDLFMICSALLTVAAIPVLLSVSPQPKQENAESLSLAELYRVSPLGLVGTFGSGLLQGTVFGMGAVYARQAGLSVAEISYFMFLLIIGAALLQWPAGKLSDRVDRRKVIAGLAAFGAVTPLVAVLMQQSGPAMVIGFAPLLGAGPLLLYSLLIAYTNDHLRPEQMVAGSSALILVFGLGASLGPPMVGGLMDGIGPVGFLLVLALVQAAIFGFCLYRMTRRAPLPVEEQSPYIGVPAMSPPSAEWVRELAEEAQELREVPEESLAKPL